MLLWFFLQDLPALEQKYPTTWKSFLQAVVKTFFGTDDPYTVELISRYLGDTTVAYETQNMSATATEAPITSTSFSISENLHLVARKLRQPDEVIGMLRGSPDGQISALETFPKEENQPRKNDYSNVMMWSGLGGGNLLSTHPPLEVRIARLKAYQKSRQPLPAPDISTGPQSRSDH